MNMAVSKAVYDEQLTTAPDLDLREVATERLSGVRTYINVAATVPMFIVADSEFFTKNSDVSPWFSANRARLDELLLDHGVLVFRGFPVADADQFNEVVNQFPPFKLGYVGGIGPRAKIAGRVMEATQLDNSLNIWQHSEMAYNHKFPAILAFFCRKPAEVAGETTIADTREFTRRLPEALRTKLETEGYRSVMNFAPCGASGGVAVTDIPDHRGWDEAYSTTDRAEVEAFCAERLQQPIWHDDGSLTIISEMDVFTKHPVTGATLYRSQIHSGSVIADPTRAEKLRALRATQKIPSGNMLGNGVPLSDEERDMINGIFQDLTVAWRWEAGDMMFVDNLLATHGRRPYVGTRDVQVALLDR